MLIPIGAPGRKYTATVTGQQTKLVACEKCGGEYVYVLKREGKGTGRSPMYLDNAGAAQRASKEAGDDLQRQLKEEDDPVPCPDCGWFQKTMVSDLRYSRMAG